MTRQFREQAPEPRGSPHRPHGATSDELEEAVLTANVDSVRCKSVAWHAGHSGVSCPAYQRLEVMVADAAIVFVQRHCFDYTGVLVEARDARAFRFSGGVVRACPAVPAVALGPLRVRPSSSPPSDYPWEIGTATLTGAATAAGSDAGRRGSAAVAIRGRGRCVFISRRARSGSCARTAW